MSLCRAYSHTRDGSSRSRRRRNFSDDSRSFSEEDGSKEGMEGSRGMIDSVRKFIARCQSVDVSGRSMEEGLE